MEYRRAQEEILDRWEDVIRQITSPAKQKANKRISYICPRCGHGTNGDGLTKDPRKPEGKGLKCFGCGFYGDIFDLIGEVEGIRDLPDQVRRAGDILGIPIEWETSSGDGHSHTKSENSSDTIRTEQKEAEEDYTAYYEECRKRLAQTDYLQNRGISEATARRFNIGYDPHYTKDTGGEVWKAIIIPTGPASYIARNTDPEATAKNRYRKTGNSRPLNPEAIRTAQKPIFITEGEIDALSIIEAGGEAIGLGSTANIDLFIRDYIEPQKPSQPLVLYMDHDKTGEEAKQKLGAKLRELGVPFYRLKPDETAKDPNELLMRDREAFIERIRTAEANIIKAFEEAKRQREKAYTERNSNLAYIQDFINGIAESVNTPAQSTGFLQLDKVLDGGLYEGLYIIGAISSLGKTTLMLQIMDQIAQLGTDVLIFSLEMARAELISKSISRHTLIDVLENGGDLRDAKTNRGITTGARWKKYSQTEKDLIQRSIQAYSEYSTHIYIQEGLGDIGTKEIREAVKEHRNITGRTPIVLVDYIQILAPNDVRASDKQNTDKAVLELKRLSRDYKTPVIGISSFNRASYKAEVDLEAFKESGAIEYGSDVLVGLQLKGAGEKDFNAIEAKRQNPREIELVILKNRNGKTGEKVSMNYYPLFNYFKETEAQPEKKRKVI